MKTGVQQIMLGTISKTESQALDTLQKIKAAGYDGIELNGFMIRPSSMMVRMLTKFAGMPTGNGGKFNWLEMTQEAGLDIISIHEDLNGIKNNPDTIIAECEKYNTKNIVITGMYRFDYTDPEAIKGLCNDLNTCGAKLAEAGITLMYHNHNVDFLKVAGTDKSAYETILDETDPDSVHFEFDSYWATECGVNVPALMRKIGTRMNLYHINDRGSRVTGPAMTPILKSGAMELGTGTMDLPTLVDIAQENGVEAIVLETHNNWINGDPMQSIEISGKYLDNLLKK